MAAEMEIGMSGLRSQNSIAAASHVLAGEGFAASHGRRLHLRPISADRLVLERTGTHG